MWAKGLGPGKCLQNELLKNAISSSLSKNCVLRSIKKCEIFYFSAVCHTLKPILLFFELHLSVDQIDFVLFLHLVPCLTEHARLLASVEHSTGLYMYTVKSCI